MGEFTCTPSASPSAVSLVLDDPVFTDVTEDGEVYRTYLVTSIVFEFTGHPEGWTHLVTVVHGDSQRQLEAFLKVADRSVDDSRVIGS